MTSRPRGRSDAPRHPTDRARVTVLDVARHAGVSQGTVSRALGGKNWVSDEARRRVLESAAALGYVPNASAQNLKTQRTRTVAAIVSDMANPLHGEFLRAAADRLRAEGYLLVVANSHGRSEIDRALLGQFRRGRVDGLIVAHADERDPGTLEALRDTRLPLVFHDRDPAGLGDAVVVDHRAGAEAVTRHLVALGHRRIALLSPPASIRPGRERRAGFEHALRAAGLRPDPALLRELDASSELGFSETKSLLSLDDPPTALICLGTRMLAGVITALNAAGRQIPEALSLVGIGDTDLVRLHSPPITTVRWDVAECGRAAATLLLARMAGEDASRAPPVERYVPVELTIRGSTGAVPPAGRRSRRR